MRFFLKLLPAYGFCADRLLAAGKMGGSKNQMFNQLQKVDWSPRTTGTTIQHKRGINEVLMSLCSDNSWIVSLPIPRFRS
jgi:hypothetical protein